MNLNLKNLIKKIWTWVRPKIKQLSKETIRLAKLGLITFAVSAVMIGFVVMASQVKVFGLFILEIVLFANLFLMLMIIPLGIFLRK